MSDLRTKVFKACRLRGLTLRKDAFDALESVLKREGDVDAALEVLLTALQERIQRSESNSAIISVEAVGAVVADLSRDEEDIKQSGLQVISAFDFPKFVYNMVKRKVVRDTSEHKLHGDAESKADLYRGRFQHIQQRLARDPKFSKPSMDGTFIQLTPIEALLGTTDLRYVLGMITQREEGRFWLEDLNSQIPVQFKSAAVSTGIYTEGCVVLAEGAMVDGAFHVQFMAQPPPEKRDDSLISMGVVDPLGVIDTPQEFRAMYDMQCRAVDSMFVVLSDVHLDNADVMTKLRVLFDGFSSTPPSVFVFMGNFLSTPFGHGRDDRERFSRCFLELADMICLFPRLAAESHFVFVPGPRDPGSAALLPRAPIPDVFTKSLRERVRNVTFASNPCRIRFFTQDIVLFRDELLMKMRRHALMPITETEQDISQHLVHTILCQSNLSPLPITVQPVYWGVDHALHLFPAPHVLFLADSFQRFHWESAASATSVLNPGCFATESQFIVYRPASRSAELSKI